MNEQNQCECGAYIPDGPTLCHKCGLKRQKEISRGRKKDMQKHVPTTEVKKK